MNRLLFLVLPLLVTGCAGGYFPISDEMVGGAKDSVSFIKDASVAKELAVHGTLRHRDTMIKEAHAHAGFKLDWASREEKIQVPGMEGPIVLSRQFPIVTYVEQARFDQPLPMAPSEHPIYKTAQAIIPAVASSIVTGVIGWKGLDVLSGGWKATAPRYEGPVNSHNPTTTIMTEIAP